MIFRIQEKFWRIGNDFTITDEKGNPQYQVDGELFSWGDNLSFQDMRGKELAIIEQKFLSLIPSYRILINDHLFARIEKKFNWFNKEFYLMCLGRTTMK